MNTSGRRILVTGAHGFLGRNLSVRLQERGDEVLPFTRQQNVEDLAALVRQADAVVHLAGENRPADVEAFDRINKGLTEIVCQAIRAKQDPIPLIFTSSTQALLDNPYGKSKRAAEIVVEQFAAETGSSAVIYRLPGVFGKWSRPDYNSVVATFCHRVVQGIPFDIHDPMAPLRLAYVDDVVDEFIRRLSSPRNGLSWGEVQPIHETTVGDLAERLAAFHASRSSLVSASVGAGLTRALYSTYVSFLTPERFAYSVPRHEDPRGVFVEMLKTKDSGQFSFFTAHPGVTRGGHYHHSKSEKFLVIKGRARFGFRHILTDEKFELLVDGEDCRIVETAPGWTHDITNVGCEEMIVMLWANEVFDRERPDTIACKV